MSYDRIWIHTDRHPNGWLERRHAATTNLSEQFALTCSRLYGQGHYVVLVAGNNHCDDALFLFETEAEAKEFYDSGFVKFESFIGSDDEGCGFQEVSLYGAGHMVATKSYASTRRTEVQHESLD